MHNHKVREISMAISLLRVRSLSRIASKNGSIITGKLMISGGGTAIDLESGDDHLRGCRVRWSGVQPLWADHHQQ